MNILAIKFFGRYGSRNINSAAHYLFRMTCTKEPNTPKGECCPEPNKPKEPIPLKTECSAPPPPPPPPCREPPPCPPIPLGPSITSPPPPDPNNPCNYTRPACSDPNYPDLTKLKKLQCKFQEDNGIPIHLKGGKFDVFLYQITILLTTVGCLNAIYKTIEEILK